MSEIIYEERRRSFLSCFYSIKEALPGLLAMFFIALFSNNLAGNPNPLTLENLFRWLDGVIGPVNHQPLFQILNSNFVWNSFLLGLIIGAGGMVGMYCGARCQKHVPEKFIKGILILTLMIIAFRYITQIFS